MIHAAVNETVPIRLNIGAGDTQLDGFIPIDRKLGTEAFPLNYPDDSVEEIRASHILEHLSYGDVEKALKEWHRVLKPGGRIRIAVPDLDKILAAKNSLRESGAEESQESWRFNLMGGQTDGDDFHRSAFDAKLLERVIGVSGFQDIRPWTSSNTDTAAHPISLNLEAVKPQNPPVLMKVAAVMSVPRVGWNDSWGCIHEALAPFCIPIRRFTGAFWGQCLQQSYEQLIESGVDWVLCIDYDTVFTARQLDKLIGYFGEHPEIDALAALQCRRGKESLPLASFCQHLIPEEMLEEVDGEKKVRCDMGPIPVGTAHFGLTLLRVECLKKMPKPWFIGLPNIYGVWGEGKATESDQPIPWIVEARKAAFGSDDCADTDFDEDIFFWNMWRKAGYSIYCAPDVRVGHLQVMVSEFDEDMQPRHVLMGDWRRAHGLCKEEVAPLIPNVVEAA